MTRQCGACWKVVKPCLDWKRCRLALQDLQAVQAAVSAGRLGFGPHGSPPRLVLLGHSLGALASLLWAGAEVEPGLAQRCSQNLQQIPVLDSSFLLQCQLTELSLPPAGASGWLGCCCGAQ